MNFLKIRMLGCLITLAILPLFATIPVTDSTDGKMPGTYGNKVVRDNFNNLHIVYTTVDGYLRYQMRPNGGAFLPLSNPSSLPMNISNFATNPALDVDSYNNVGIVNIETTGGSPTTGNLYYFYRDPNNNNMWAAEILANQASQPSIAVRKGTAHVVWIHDRSVKYLSFPVNNPPFFGTATPDTVIQTNCNYSGFSKPSIGLIHNVCDPATPVVGYQYYSDEIVQVGLQCPYMGTRVGPQVSIYDAGTGWSVLWDDIRTQNNPQNMPRLEMTSLSLSTCFKSGSIYLAYSDILDANGRTMIAVGNRTTWNKDTVDANEASNIDMMANRHYNGGEFRIAWANSNQTQYQTGQWEPYQNTPFYMTNTQYVGSTTGFVTALAPQAIFDKSCIDGSPNTHVFYEYVIQGTLEMIFYDLGNDSECNNVLYDVWPPCNGNKIFVDNNGSTGILVSLADFGRILGAPKGNSVVFVSGEDHFVIRWDEGELGTYWGNGFSLEGGQNIYIEGPPNREIPEIVRLR